MYLFTIFMHILADFDPRPAADKGVYRDPPEHFRDPHLDGNHLLPCACLSQLCLLRRGAPGAPRWADSCGRWRWDREGLTPTDHQRRSRVERNVGVRDAGKGPRGRKTWTGQRTC